MKVEIEPLRKTQTEIKLEHLKSNKQKKTSEVNLTNKVQDMAERISGIEDKVEEMDTLIKIC